MNPQTGERIAHSMITILAFCVGLLLGPRFCASPVDEQDSPATTSEVVTGDADKNVIDFHDMDESLSRANTPCPETRIVYQCPPEEEEEPVKKQGVSTSQKKKLPPPEPELDPLLRKRLLAWVRDRSDTLKVCRDDGQEIYRMAVIMFVDKSTARVQRVSVNASRGVVPSAVLTCVRRKVQEWKPPAELTQGRTQLVFGLNI